MPQNPLSNPPAPAPAESDSEDDYMKMTFDDDHSGAGPSSSGKKKPAAETSLQRRQRLRREGEARARVKSKAELEAEAEEARETALRTSLLDDEARRARSKGFAMMAKMGFKGGALGRKREGDDDGRGGGGGVAADGEEQRGGEGGADPGLAEPIRVEIKDDRGGIGMESEKKRRMKEAADEYECTAKRAKADEGEYRERVRREREVARLERQVVAAQRIAERMDEESAGGAVAAEGEGKKDVKRAVASRPLKSVNVLWRGLVRAREEAERDRRMRRDLEQSLSRLPTYEDEDEDEDDKRALGKSKTVYEVAEDLDEEDPELDEFNALEPEEQLRRLVEHLRKEHHYCFWCKFTYPDESMEGCPGLTEADHD